MSATSLGTTTAPSRSPATVTVSRIDNSRSVPVTESSPSAISRRNPDKTWSEPVRLVAPGGGGQSVGQDVALASELHSEAFPTSRC